MKYISMLSTKRLQRYKARGRLGKSPLVIEVVGMLNEDKNEEEESIIRFGSMTS